MFGLSGGLRHLQLDRVSRVRPRVRVEQKRPVPENRQSTMSTGYVSTGRYLGRDGFRHISRKPRSIRIYLYIRFSTIILSFADAL